MRFACLFLVALAACSSDPDGVPDAGTHTPDARADSGVDRPDSGPEDAVDLTALSDSFEGNQLDPSWSVLEPDAVMIEVLGGALLMTLRRHALWFNDSRGVLLSKPVRGDFKASAIVRARKSSAPLEPADRFVHLAGIAARDPVSPPENYVFIVVGRDENDRSVETKTTRDSVSQYSGPSWPSGDAELRLCRRGSTFTLYKREIGANSWTLAETYDRPDLPEILAVGPNIYGIDQGQGVDLRATFEEVRFAPVGAGCDQD